MLQRIAIFTPCLFMSVLYSTRMNIMITGDLLKLLDVAVDETVLPTTYGKLHPPLGTNRLKVSVCLTSTLTFIRIT